MKRRLAVAAGLVAALLAAHGVAWAWTVRQLDAGLARWVEARRAAGWAVSTGRTAPTGWPAAAGLLVPDLAVASGDWALSWHGDILLRVVPADYRWLQVRTVGAQRVQVGTAPPLELAADSAVGLVALDAPEAAVIQVEGLRARSARGEVSVESLRGRVTTLSAVLMAERIRSPAGPDWPQGVVVDAASLDARLSASPPAGSSPAERARQWQRAGGAVQVRQVVVKWGELNAKGSGIVALDDSLLPQAEGTLRLEGYVAALDALGGAGLLPGGVLAATAVLTLMARRQPDGTETVEIPLRLQGGVVQAGQVPVLRLPPLDWTTP